jgi:FAD/FMN-containing dehydrogenase
LGLQPLTEQGSVAPAGGFGQTSGHSPISNLYGLGADNFLEFKVVTPDGKLRVANKVSNQDLFWALRGGGGSTFGVVVEATIKAHPDIPITLAFWELNVTDPNAEGVWDAYTELHRHFADFSAKKMSGYYYHYGNRLTGAFLHKAEGAGEAKAKEIWQPLLAKMLSFGGLRHSNFSIVEHSNFKSYFDSRFGKLGQMKETPWDQAAKNTPASPKLARRHGPGEHDAAPVASAIANLDSRLLSAADLASADLKAALKAAFPKGLDPRQTLLQGHLVGGGKMAHPDDDTSVLPAWRSTLTHVIGYKVAGKASVDALRKLSPNSGAYVNEAFALEENWKESFWGSNYAKLSQIKAKYDPDMLLWVSPGINADLLEARQGRACKRVSAYTKNTAPLSDNANNGRVLGQVN